MAFVNPPSSFPDGSSFSNVAALQSLLKERYLNPTMVQRLTYKKNPLFAMLNKKEDMTGMDWVIPVIYANPAGGSRTFSSAQTTQAASQNTRFVIQATQDYHPVTITGFAIESTRDNVGAFVSARKVELDGAFEDITNNAAGAIFRKSTGTRGVGTISSGVITFTDPQDVTQFEVGMVLEAATTDGGAAIGSPNYGYVFRVDRTAGTITVATSTANALAKTAGSPTSWEGQTDYFRRIGDRNLSVLGLQDWIPSSIATSGDSLGGVDRAADPTRLGGVRYDGSKQEVVEAITDTMALAGREECDANVAVCSNNTYVAFVKAVGAKREYVEASIDKAQVSFRGLRLSGPWGDINVFADRSCPANKLWGLDLETWTLGSMRGVPHISNLDGLMGREVYNTDGLEIRIKAYYQLFTDKPGSNFYASMQY